MLTAFVRSRTAVLPATPAVGLALALPVPRRGAASPGASPSSRAALTRSPADRWFVPAGLARYWAMSNLWTFVQQGLVWRFAPTPGSPAALRRKAAHQAA